MMVVFVSQCEKNALIRTRRVLDAFADRIGDNTWQTIITHEGLLAVRKLLRKTASKNTAVSCHWIRTRSRTELIWVVGNRQKFNSKGIVPVNSTSKSLNPKEDFFLNKTVIACFAQLSGLFHDVGKAMTLFQNKLQPDFSGKSFEPYRHEWVSLRIFQAFVNQQPDFEWLQALANIDNSAEESMMRCLVSLRDGLDPNPINPFKTLPPIAKLVAWLIVSHHKLPQYPKKSDNPPTFETIDHWLNDHFEACWNSPQCLNDDWSKKVIEDNWYFPHGTPFRSAYWQTQASLTAKKILKCERMFAQDWFNQHFTAHIARLSLMLSDHYYSSEKETSPEWQDRNYQAYANTDRDEDGNKILKQKLDEHNIVVGINAYDIATALPQLREELPALTCKRLRLDNVLAHQQEQFGWQDNAYKLALSVKEKTKKHGFFGVCMASTGKGKTRANARIMYGLSDEETCRFSVALGLRTLTLQTGEALKKDLELKSGDLAVLIGSQAVSDLYQQSRVLESSESQQMGSESAESLLEADLALIEELPDYLGRCAKWFKHDPKILKLIQAPVLVSTIDYLIPASDGIRGGRQIAPMLRLLTSDLVLDEPDDFGLEDLPALCRLVNWAGMLGSNVLLSTATLSPALANALFCAYQQGRKQYTRVNTEQGETTAIGCAWFDEFKKPQFALVNHSAGYLEKHHSFVARRIKNINNKTSPIRKAKLIAVAPNSEQKPSQWLASYIQQSMQTLHQHHAIKIDQKKVTIGLVRMANIDPLVQVAKHLLKADAPSDTVIHYCVYHSQFPLVHRSAIEKQLDTFLSRHHKETWLTQTNIKQLVDKHPETNHLFVVLATAVSEVGRDHDYDWAIVEPSSMRSIIQLAGRVQRHRQQCSADENIHILSKNYKGLKGRSPCFEKPGFESKSLGYASRDLANLIKANELAIINAIARIQEPKMTVLPTSDLKRFESFNELEHCAQKTRLLGHAKESNHAAQWWEHEVTWCAEVQRLQPFR